MDWGQGSVQWTGAKVVSSGLGPRCELDVMPMPMGHHYPPPTIPLPWITTIPSHYPLSLSPSNYPPPTIPLPLSPSNYPPPTIPLPWVTTIPLQLSPSHYPPPTIPLPLSPSHYPPPTIPLPLSPSHGSPLSIIL